MSRRCELTGKTVLVGNNVSHANNKTKRRFLPNLVQVTLMSDVLKQKVRMKIAASTLRSLERQGGLDAFLMKAKEANLSQKARLLRRRLQKKNAAPVAPAESTASAA